ncbi:nitroreductase family protein [Gallaecimonas sp. GXIMD4217]|uniref:nitroreductase family protein n=1 Tax=Gallaecimonas sp. GXIMD4217 TaxID=3131927 RepID=UPI00311B3286
MSITALLESRTSVGRYDPEHRLDEQSIRELVRLATLAPSAYNMQNWRFIAVQSPEAKEKLKAAAYGQSQVVDAAVTFILCGTLRAYEGMAEALQPSVDAGILSPELMDGWITTAATGHQGNPQLQRDEALRSASLAAMTLMLAAQGMGLATGPMSGFDAGALAEAFGLDETQVPVMLIAVGRPQANNWPQKPRLPVDRVLSFA